jgi:hypothetical protein
MLAQHERGTTPLDLVSQAASTSSAGQLPRPDTVKAGLTSNRPRRWVENDEYAAFVLRAYSRRVGDGDVEALVLMSGLAEEIDTAIAQAVKGLAPTATPGPRSAPGSASPAKPHSSAGEHPDPTQGIRTPPLCAPGEMILSRRPKPNRRGSPTSAADQAPGGR